MLKIFEIIKLSAAAVILTFLSLFGAERCAAQPNDADFKLINELIAFDPKSDNLYIQRGDKYLYAGRLAEALADAEKALALNPKNSDVFMLRGQIKIKQKDDEGALIDLSRAINAYPQGYPLAYLMRAELYEKKGYLRRAYLDYQKLKYLTLNPKAPQGIARLESRMKAEGIDFAAAATEAKNKEPEPDIESIAKESERVESKTPAATLNGAAATGNPPAGGTLNQTADDYIQSFKQQASFDGKIIVAEGTADKLVPRQKSLFNQLSFEAYSKEFVLLVFTDDPTYDSFIFVNGDIITNPFTDKDKGYYVSAPQITKLLNNQYLNAVRLSFNNVARKVSVEFRADKPGKVRYILFIDKAKNDVVAGNNNAASGDQPKYWANLGANQYNQKNYPEAVKSYTECLRLKPDAALCFQARGLSYFNLKKYEESVGDLSKALQIEPNNASSYAGRADAYSRLQKYDSAIPDYSKAIDLNPQHGVAYGGRGYAYLQLKKYNEAIADFSKSLQISPTYASYHNRGLTYDILGRNEDALADYSKAIELDAGFAIAYYHRGMLFNRLKRFTEAIADETKAVQLEPQNADAYFERGYAYYFLKRYDEAIADYTKAIQLKSDYAFAYGNRGGSYILIQKYNEAIADLTRAIEIDPKQTNFYANRAIAFCRQGKIAPAQADEQKVIGLGGKVTNPCR